MSKISGLDQMTCSQLLELRARVDAAIASAREARKLDLPSILRGLAATKGKTTAEMVGGKPRAAETTIKYRNPADPSQTWTGRGRKPNWLGQAEKKGQKLESFAV
jgi:DNA-binding protein H-NS